MLPRMAPIWLRMVRTIRSASASRSRVLPLASPIEAAIAFAVIAGCLVATVPPSMWISMKPSP